jgi:phosphate transport system substrate-binding protein
LIDLYQKVQYLYKDYIEYNKETLEMKQMIRFTYLIVILALIALPLAGCGGTQSQAPASGSADEKLSGTIAVSGAFALYPMMNRWAEEFGKLHPDVKFDVSAGGAGKGMTDVLSKAVDIAMVSRAISSDEEGKGAFFVPVTKDAVFATINTQNPVYQDLMQKGVTKEQMIDVFITGKIKTWGELVGRPEVTDVIHVFTRSDSAGAADAWAKYLGNKKQEDLQGVGVSGDPGVLEAVVKDPLAIGYNNLGYAFDATSGKPVAGSNVLPLDSNGNGKADPEEVLETKTEAVEAVAAGKYPSPPARDLNLVTNGKPTGVELAFLKWILTDGQKYVGEAGYVQLPAEQLKAALQKLQ